MAYTPLAFVNGAPPPLNGANLNHIQAGITAAHSMADSAATWAGTSGKPVFATVATSGSYNDLGDKPTIISVTVSATPPPSPSVGDIWVDTSA